VTSRHESRRHRQADIAAYVDGELPLDVRLVIKAQIDECWECQDLVRIFEGVSRQIDLLNLQPAQVPVRLRARIMTDLPTGRRLMPRVPRLQSWPRFANAFVAACLLLIASTSFVVLGHGFPGGGQASHTGSQVATPIQSSIGHTQAVEVQGKSTGMQRTRLIV